MLCKVKKSVKANQYNLLQQVGGLVDASASSVTWVLIITEKLRDSVTCKKLFEQINNEPFNIITYNPWLGLIYTTYFTNGLYWISTPAKALL